MDARKERTRTRSSGSVPQFGDWDTKSPGTANISYSMVFSEAREIRKQKKNDIRHVSFGNDKELMAAAVRHEDKAMRKRRILTYINCCIRP